MSVDYEVTLVPPIFVDKGTVSFNCEDLSFNTAWRIKLNETKKFFDFMMSHVLIQINPNKFSFKIDSYSDLTSLISKELEIITQYAINEIFGMLQY